MAFEFVLARIPEVNPEEIYSAGHSSAGTLSLLVGVHEQRLAGCVAYAPGIDLEGWFEELLAEPLIETLYPGLERFVRKSSPLTHVNNLEGPLFLFHAQDDLIVEVEDSRNFVRLLKDQDKEVDYLEVETGGHYQPMISTGIPKGIEWIQNR